MTVSEGLSKEIALNIARTNAGEIERCSLGNEPREDLVLELTITPGGKIKTVKVVSGFLKNRNAERCIVEAVKKWVFPATQGGKEVTATISFVFGSKQTTSSNG
jgi:TonB family protein